jgi:hypothetical protein
MRKLLLSLTTFGIAMATVGCGAGSGTDASTTSTSTPTAASDASTASAGSAAAGVATDAGFAQLYQGGVPVAWRASRETATISDGVTVDAVALASSLGGPGTPTVQNTSADGQALALANGQTASGTFTFISDQLAPDLSTLPTNWWHVKLAFDHQTQAFTVTNDDGASATITAGELDLYIYDVTTAGSAPGNWTRTAQVYSVIPSTNPLTMTITPTSGGTRNSTLTGIRHAQHAITRSNDGTNVTRAETTTVDGDATTLLGAIPSVSTLQVASGPTLADAGTPATNRLFTKWLHTTTLADASVHPLQWDRWATFTVTKVRPASATAWSSITFSNEQQAIYLTRNGVQAGPFTRQQLASGFNLVMDLTKAGQSL